MPQLNIWLPDDLAERLARVAKACERSRSEYARLAIRNQLNTDQLTKDHVAHRTQRKEKP